MSFRYYIVCAAIRCIASLARVMRVWPRGKTSFTGFLHASWSVHRPVKRWQPHIEGYTQSCRCAYNAIAYGRGVEHPRTWIGRLRYDKLIPASVHIILN